MPMTDDDAQVVFRVKRTPTGCKVVVYDRRGLGDSLFTKHNRRYCYGDDAEEKATEYARKKAESCENSRVVELGEQL